MTLRDRPRKTPSEIISATEALIKKHRDSVNGWIAANHPTRKMNMSKLFDISRHRKPVNYSISITHHWDDTLEITVNDVSDDDRSRFSVIDSLRRIGGYQESADNIHRELLSQINALTGAVPGTKEADTLSRLTKLVGDYEQIRFQK